MDSDVHDSERHNQAAEAACRYSSNRVAPVIDSGVHDSDGHNEAAGAACRCSSTRAASNTLKATDSPSSQTETGISNQPLLRYLAITVCSLLLLGGGVLIGVFIQHLLTDSDSEFPSWGTMPIDHCAAFAVSSGACKTISLAGIEAAVHSALPGLASADRASYRLWRGDAAAFEATMSSIAGLLTDQFLPWSQSAVLDELAVMHQMTALHNEIVTYAPTVNGAPWPAQEEIAVFQAEDAVSDVYLRALLNSTGEAFPDAAVDASITCGAVGLRFKDTFQRARPYQVAFMLGSPLQHRLATSATTPSFPSGHALQTYCEVAAILDLDLSLAADIQSALFSLAHDVGDRRVLAGVHYPSDNYASAMIFNEIVSLAWPVAFSKGLRFGRSAEERALLCNGNSFPTMCRHPSEQPGTLFQL